jgi:N-acetylmuramoyl-L-alanine amidase
MAEENFLLPLEEYSWEREYAPEYVVIHFTSNVVNNPQNPFDMDAIRNVFVSGGVSINYIIDRNGKVQCWIPEDRAAWHAGRGTFASDEKYTNAMNKYSIGIEIAATGSQKDMAQYLSPYEYSLLDESFVGYTDEQYETLKKLVKDVCERNGIPFDRQHVIGHEEYNPEKSDPGELFDWGKLFQKSYD